MLLSKGITRLDLSWLTMTSNLGAHVEDPSEPTVVAIAAYTIVNHQQHI